MKGQPPLDAWAQDPEFVAVSRVMEARDPWATSVITETVFKVGRLGPFTAEDIIAVVGRETMGSNQIGAVFGSLAKRNVIRCVGDVRAHHKGAKGRRILRWELARAAPCALPSEVAGHSRLQLVLPPPPEVHA